jgi:hypothetical protein
MCKVGIVEYSVSGECGEGRDSGGKNRGRRIGKRKYKRRE